jgi:hypothetical protein
LRSNKGEIGKRRTREHVIADLSINHVERFVLRCGWTVQRTSHDYGIDLVMETFNEVGEPQNGRVLFQLKATDTLKKRDNGRTVAAGSMAEIFWLGATSRCPLYWSCTTPKPTWPTGSTYKNISSARAASR